MSRFAESDIEEAALEWLAALGYGVVNGQEIAPDSRSPERTSYGDVTLSQRLARAVDRLNPGLPVEARTDALRRIEQVEYPGLVEENRRLHRFLAEGVPDRATAVALYAAWVEAFRQRDPVGFERWLAPLRGHDLACYCPLDGGPCHAYTLLRLAAEVRPDPGQAPAGRRPASKK
jgi:hypothetical protein